MEAVAVSEWANCSVSYRLTGGAMVVYLRVRAAALCRYGIQR